MTGLGLLAQRRAAVRAEQAALTDASLGAAAAELRSQAAPYLLAGRLDLAAPYLEEAEMFESARRRPLGL